MRQGCHKSSLSPYQEGKWEYVLSDLWSETRVVTLKFAFAMSGKDFNDLN